MNTCSMHVNLLGLLRPKAYRTTVWKVFPSNDEIVPCLVIAAATLLGLWLAAMRISGV
jgi:hypothetical protein